jgi:phosphatidylethanolamine-binding protein (PEBP) family uncharacterized protein
VNPIEILLTPLGKAFRHRRADESRSLSNDPAFATGARLTVTSATFREGEEIPARCCGALIGRNVSPSLGWRDLPAGATDVLLVMEDLDSPGAAPRIHVVAEFRASLDDLPEGALDGGTEGIAFLPGRGGPRVYAGPRPLPGHGTHHYRFRLFALDRAIDLATVGSADALPGAIAGHVLASGVLTGTRAA